MKQSVNNADKLTSEIFVSFWFKSNFYKRFGLELLNDTWSQ